VFETEAGCAANRGYWGYDIDLYAASQYGFFEDLTGGTASKVFQRRSSTRFLRLGQPAWRAVRRQRVSELLRR
jgi:fumarylacetoacetase